MSIVSYVKFAVQKLRGKGQQCSHTDQIRDVTPRSEGCEQCIARGDTWVHLRTCMGCGR